MSIGTAHTRVEGAIKVRGAAKYAADVYPMERCSRAPSALRSPRGGSPASMRPEHSPCLA
jgi:hypothetical protein